MLSKVGIPVDTRSWLFDRDTFVPHIRTFFDAIFLWKHDFPTGADIFVYKYNLKEVARGGS